MLSKEENSVTTKKMAWKKPELVVLARSRPEEAVLAGCKYPSEFQTTGPNKKTCANNNAQCASQLPS